MTVEEFYNKLSSVYSSPYPDKPDETSTAMSVLSNAWLRQNVKDEVFYEKLKQMMNLQKGMKTKFSTAVIDKYWEKNFIKPITYRTYDEDQI